MAGMPHITAADAIAIRSASKKLKFNPIKLMKLEKAQRKGMSSDEAFAELLGVPVGTDIPAYLESVLTPEEYETFYRILGGFVEPKSAKDTK